MNAFIRTILRAAYIAWRDRKQPKGEQQVNTEPPIAEFKEHADEDDYRAGLVALAVAEKDSTKKFQYFKEAFPPSYTKTYPVAWCQAFYVAMLHRRGLAKTVFCKQGFGAEHIFSTGRTPLKYTQDPKPGDLAYFARKEHHAMVEKCEGEIVSLINGNGVGGKVTLTRVLKKDVSLFYSISGVIAEALALERDRDTQPCGTPFA